MRSRGPNRIRIKSRYALVEGLYGHHVVEILHESKSQPSRADRAQRLMKEAVEKSGRDNTTALVIEIV
jgi:serine/threonine protein phosphatase PrpC